MPVLEANGVHLYYEVQGKGPTLVLTHGASWDHRQWEPQVEALQDTHQVITWDARGHGRSSLPPGPVDSEDFSRDLIALLDHLGAARAVLGGLSMGGHISLQASARYPERVAALILIGTPFTNTFNLYERVFVPINRFSTRFVPMPLFARLQARMLSKHNPDVLAYVEEATRQIPHERWLRLWNAISRMESRADLTRITCPTLVLEGDGDWMTNRQQKELVQGLSNATHRLIPKAGHATNLDNPEAVNQAMLEFLRSPSVQTSLKLA